MKKAITAAIAIAAAAAAFFLYQSLQQPDVTMNKAGEKLAEQYGGTVKKAEQADGEFRYTIEVPDEGQYSMTVDSETGELVAMTRLETVENETNVQEEKTEKGARQLTTEEAGEIALKKVPGTVDDIEQGDGEEAGSYLVDIDAQNGEEVTVRINAISGEVLSISWDD